MKALDALKFTTRVDAHPDGVKRETTWSALAGFEYVGLRIDGRTTFPEDPDDRVKTWSVNLSLRPGAALLLADYCTDWPSGQVPLLRLIVESEGRPPEVISPSSARIAPPWHLRDAANQFVKNICQLDINGGEMCYYVASDQLSQLLRVAALHVLEPLFVRYT